MSPPAFSRGGWVSYFWVFGCSRFSSGEIVYRAPSQYEDGLSRYGDSCYKVKTVVRLSCLYNGNSYADKPASFHWDMHRNKPNITYLLTFHWDSPQHARLYLMWKCAMHVSTESLEQQRPGQVAIRYFFFILHVNFYSLDYNILLSLTLVWYRTSLLIFVLSLSRINFSFWYWYFLIFVWI